MHSYSRVHVFAILQPEPIGPNLFSHLMGILAFSVCLKSHPWIDHLQNQKNCIVYQKNNNWYTSNFVKLVFDHMAF